MFGLMLVLLYGFAMGLRRGFGSCLALCMPSLVPALIEQGGGWRKGLRIALWFNAPRVILLTLVGAGIGAGGSYLGSFADSSAQGTDAWLLGYVLIGLLMFFYGLHVFMSADDRLERLSEGKKPECRPAHPLLSRLKFATPKTRGGLLLWGGIVSIACIGETVLSLEAIFVGLSLADASSPPAGAALGGLAFFLFSLGASLPSLGFAGLGSNLALREKRVRRLLQAERVAGALMVLFGCIYLSLFIII